MKRPNKAGPLIMIIFAIGVAIIIRALLMQRPWTWNFQDVITLAVIFIIAYGLIHVFVQDIRGNLEVFVIAFILAMTIRCFCIEVFKIPTSSMEPTLMGSQSSGDRIIASKFINFFQPVKRFDVILFKYPLDRTKNFIKRVVGLPNEEILTQNGDIFYKPTEATTFYLARKPLKVQESIWLPVAVGPGSPDWVEEDWEMPSDSELKKNRIWLQPQSTSQDGVSLRYREAIKDFYNSRGGDYEVTDLKVAFKLRFTQSRGKLVAQIRSARDKFILYLANHSTENQVQPPEADKENYLEHISQSTGKTQKISIKTTLLPEKDYFLEFMYYDGSVYVKLNKKLICQYDYQTTLSEESNGVSRKNPIIIKATQGKLALWDIRIYRDIYYHGLRESVAIPARKYLVIGDNVSNSQDSRAWRIKRVFLTGGEVIECDERYFRNKGDYIEIWRDGDKNKGGDIWGNEYTISWKQIKDIQEEPYRFVDETAIFGKGLLVYWPIHRLKLIR